MPNQPAARPVKSAKDAINAMYATGDAKKLPRPTQPKSPIHAPRPATSRLKPAPRVGITPKPTPKSSSTGNAPVVRPEVKTSLKLNPKKPTIVRAPRAVATTPRKTMDLRPAKKNTQLAISAIKKAAATATASVASSKPSAAPKPTPRLNLSGTRRMDDIRRPAPTSTTAPVESPTTAPAETLQTVAERMSRSEKKSRLRPLDSIKNRFRPAPKDFSAQDADQIRPLKAQNYQNPSFAPTPTPTHEAIHLYGMTEGPDTFASAPDLIEPDQPTADDANLGVIEDYHSATPASSPASQPSAKSSSPDNNRYALGGRSPFFLKSVSVEKRPLSDDPVTRRTPDPSLASAQNLSDKSTKNVYSKKSKKLAKSKTITPTKPSDSALNSRPTVIVPARRRSHAPLFVLLIVTVILGAIAGAAVYLFLFQ